MVKGKARAAGSFLGGLANNPAIVIIALVLGGLFIFKDRISEAFASVGSSIGAGIGDIELPPIVLPTINLPEINFPEFPALPDFSGLFQQQQDFFSNLINQFNFAVSPDIPKPTKMVEDTGLDPLATCECGASIVQDAFGNVNVTCKECAAPVGMNPALALEPSDAELFASQDTGLTPAQLFAQQKGGFIVPQTNPFGIGGGISFIGGQTTFGDSGNIVDTLSEVLSIFPNLTASQAADALAQNVGLTKNEFAQVDPDIVNISSAGFDPDQIILNASGGFSGLTPQQIALILTGGNIQNF